MHECSSEAVYGGLCKVHARQVAGTPEGFQYNRIKRNHLQNLSHKDIAQSIELYLLDNGKPITKPANPFSYKSEVIQYIRNNKEVTASQIVEFINEKSNKKLASSSIGQLTRSLMAKQIIVRRKTSINGRSVTLYALYDEVELISPEEI
tara:strand:+ start:11415 stop:11861 length:447 start_codon:yes stop_codon:yes gene_type:complete